MQQILFFLIRNKNFLLFFFLFSISVALTIQSHTYHKNKFINSANIISGGIYSVKSNIINYFNLKKENELLLEENARVRKQLEAFKMSTLTQKIDTNALFYKYNFITAKVINNSYSKTKNRLTLNKGLKDSVQLDMGVITSKGIVGIIDNVSNNYATTFSILSENSQVNAKLKNSNHFGSLVWNTENPNIVQLIDIPRLAPVTVRDTIITGGKSTIFPEGILIGTVHNFILNKDQNSLTLNVSLFNDMTNLKHVYIIKNIDAPEIIALEKQVNNEK